MRNICITENAASEVPARNDWWLTVILEVTKQKKGNVLWYEEYMK